MSNRVKVEIYGQSYTLGGDLDEAYVQKLARYVDEKMIAVGKPRKRWTRSASPCSRPWRLPMNSIRASRIRGIGTTHCASVPSSA